MDVDLGASRPARSGCTRPRPAPGTTWRSSASPTTSGGAVKRLQQVVGGNRLGGVAGRLGARSASRVTCSAALTSRSPAGRPTTAVVSGVQLRGVTVMVSRPAVAGRPSRFCMHPRRDHRRSASGRLQPGTSYSSPLGHWPRPAEARRSPPPCRTRCRSTRRRPSDHRSARQPSTVMRGTSRPGCRRPSRGGPRGRREPASPSCFARTTSL